MMRGPGRTAIVAAVTALFLTACAGEQARACATVDTPPIAVDPARCTAPPGDGNLTNGVRWYTAPAADVADDDERPIPGQALDGDWWDWTEQADMGEGGHSKKVTKAPRATPKKKATKR